MDLHIKSDRHNTTRLRTTAGLELFSISVSTVQPYQRLWLRSNLPGMDGATIELPDDVSRYGAEATDLAIARASEMLAAWLKDHVGADIAINLVRE